MNEEICKWSGNDHVSVVRGGGANMTIDAVALFERANEHHAQGRAGDAWAIVKALGCTLHIYPQGFPELYAKLSIMMGRDSVSNMV